MDHRGTPECPGLVCTLIPENDWTDLNLDDGYESGKTFGVAYLVS